MHWMDRNGTDWIGLDLSDGVGVGVASTLHRCVHILLYIRICVYAYITCTTCVHPSFPSKQSPISLVVSLFVYSVQNPSARGNHALFSFLSLVVSVSVWIGWYVTLTPFNPQ